MMCLLFVVSIDQIVSEHDEFAKIWAIIIHTAILSNDGYCFIDPEHNVPWLDNVNQLYVQNNLYYSLLLWMILYLIFLSC